MNTYPDQLPTEGQEKQVEDATEQVCEALRQFFKDVRNHEEPEWSSMDELIYDALKEFRDTTLAENQQLREQVEKGSRDSKRLDWLDKRFVRNVPATTKSVYFSTNGDLTLRDAIDEASSSAQAQEKRP